MFCLEVKIMARKHYRAKSGKMMVDLSDFDALMVRLQTAKYETVHHLEMWANMWGKMYKDSYMSKIEYATGFKRSKKYNASTPFYEVEFANNNGIVSIHIGHMSFLAKFLEVGTQAHEIAPRIRGKTQIRNISGIKGSKALSNTYKERKAEMMKDLEREINELLKY